jgi:Fe-Mn family superoxide dismutase
MKPSSPKIQTRREALKTLGAGAFLIGATAPTALASSEALAVSETMIGYKDGEYILPPLPYAMDALEPYIDTETMRVHYEILHANYVRGANRVSAALAELAQGKRDASEAKCLERDLAFFGSGHALHTLFWNNMSPNGGKEPSGPLADALVQSFGSFENFMRQFTAAALGVEGSGWSLLSYEPISGRLIVLQVEKQQNLTFQGAIPLLGCDVWEHAYFLKYKAARADYVEAFKKVINWDDVSYRYNIVSV